MSSEPVRIAISSFNSRTSDNFPLTIFISYLVIMRLCVIFSSSATIPNPLSDSKISFPIDIKASLFSILSEVLGCSNNVNGGNV